jgi:hypothetical protein
MPSMPLVRTKVPFSRAVGVASQVGVTDCRPESRRHEGCAGVPTPAVVPQVSSAVTKEAIG